MDGKMYSFFYRKDIFDKYNLQVPRTWDEVLETAQHMNGTNWNGDGLPDYGMCLQRAPSELFTTGPVSCSLRDLLAAGPQ